MANAATSFLVTILKVDARPAVSESHFPRTTTRILLSIDNSTKLDKRVEQAVNDDRIALALEREVLRLALPLIGLPADTKASHSMKAACWCGCSPCWVIVGDALPRDVYVDYTARVK